MHTLTTVSALAMGCIPDTNSPLLSAILGPVKRNLSGIIRTTKGLLYLTG